MITVEWLFYICRSSCIPTIS